MWLIQFYALLINHTINYVLNFIAGGINFHQNKIWYQLKSMPSIFNGQDYQLYATREFHTSHSLKRVGGIRISIRMQSNCDCVKGFYAGFRLQKSADSKPRILAPISGTSLLMNP